MRKEALMKTTLSINDESYVRRVQVDNSFQSAFGSVTQTSDPVMGRFDLGELTGNKLLR